MTGFAAGLRASDVQPGTVVSIVVAGHPLCVGQTTDGRWGAIDDVCTHDGGDLADGELDGLPPVVPVRAYPVHLDGDEIVVDLP